MPKHIKVELDFIPVEDGLPVDFTSVFALTRMRGSFFFLGKRVFHAHGEWLDSEYCDVVEVAYWAKMPETEIKKT